MSSPANILVLCTGNICRSPIAEAYLQSKLPNTKVRSAGIAALEGHPADEHSIAVSDALGLDLRNHKAQQLTPDLLAEYDLVFVMTASQKSKLEQKYPWSRGRVFRLGEWDRIDIDDPVGMDRDTFEKAAQAIVKTSDTWLARLVPKRKNLSA